MNDEITSTMEELNFLFRKKWTICVLTDLHLGSKHFQDFNNNLPEISTKVLHQTLNELEEAGLIDKKVIQDKPKTTEYALTEKGRLSKNFIKEYYGYIASISSNSSDEEEILKRIMEL
ncbi:MAG: helix-turn-helix transcriptional regulator [Methanobrevibacter sp.]|uniref:winged helix-turn-helix transcriptional regulator n=1 Tax=Methanobrevibacter sp. TaxID=66852 RepID=UPI001B663325|nr:helix-turn-helix domain-containing protein [Methanobrevibacter sp.]MBP3790739.1 helix-turn-helix transcriptional regulator [Methanobrevibacter sp.]